MANFFVMNSAIIVSYGTFEHVKINEHEAIEWLHNNPWLSAVSHAPTAVLMSQRLGVNIPTHKMSVRMAPGDEVLTLRVLRRLPENCTFTPYEIQHTPCEFSVIRMVK